jgi:hypothetical protein
MRIRVPESGDLRGQLLLHTPLSIGTMIGMFLGVIFAPSAPLAGAIALAGGLVGSGVGVVLVRWRARMSAAGYRPVLG